jgi:hypothetical protein
MMAAIAAAAKDEIDRREAHEARRQFALSGTPNWAQVTGASIMAPKRGMYPWLQYATDFANYLDSPSPLGLAIPIKPGFIARLHLKTSIAGEALARFALANPEKRNAIFSWEVEKAKENLSQISFGYKSQALQELFPDVLYPDDTKGRFKYKGSSVLLKREGNYKEPSIMALGSKTNRTGKHFNGVIWLDDMVTEDNYRNPEIQKQIWDLIQYVANCIAEPGCQIWITGTRYAHYDAYSYLLDKDSKVKHQIVNGYPNIGCWEEKEDGSREALFKWKYCVTPEEKTEPVEFEGKTYTPVRSSLDEMRSSMDPILFAAQFLNSPMIGGQATFNAADFENIVPVTGHELDTYLEYNGELIDPSKPERGILDTCVPGDPAYGDKTHNDNSILLTVSQDQYDYWYVREARVTRDGWRGIEDYLRVACSWYKLYSARQVAIETHAKESTRSLFERIERELGLFVQWNPLKVNSGGRNGARKNERIALSLEELVRGGRLWFCIPEGETNHPVELFRQLLIKEAVQFPSGRHDDAIDCLSNCRQCFRVRHGEQEKEVVFNPGRKNLPAGMKKWLA